MLNESFTQHMDAIKSCSTKQQCSIKVYLRDILDPYVNLQSGYFLGGGGGHSITYSIFPPPLPPPKKSRLPLRFPGFSRFCLYFSSSFLNISSLYVESNHKLGGQTRTLLGASLYLLVF